MTAALYLSAIASAAGEAGAVSFNKDVLPIFQKHCQDCHRPNQIAPMSVSFAIPEARLPELKKYMSQGALRVTASPPKDDAAPAVGKISFVDNQVDQTTGTIKLKGTFSNEDRRLWPGQFLNVVVTLTSDPMAIVVPTPAVQVGQQGSYVFIVKDDRTVEMRPVVVSRTSASETVVASGVKPARMLPSGRASYQIWLARS